MSKSALIYYKHNKLGTLFVSDKYVYEMLVYSLEERQVSLYDSKENISKEFKGFSVSKIVIKKDKKFMQCIDLLGAPLSFIEDNKFIKYSK